MFGMDGWVYGWVDGRMNGLNEWLDVWVSGWADEWLWMDGWMYGCLDVCVCRLLVVVLLSLWRGLISRKLLLAGGPWRGLISRKLSLSVVLCCLLFCCCLVVSGGCMGEWMDGWMDGWMDVWVSGRFFGWLDGWMDVWVSGWMDGWVNGCMGGWVNDMDVWMDVEVDGSGSTDEWLDGWRFGASEPDYQEEVVEVEARGTWKYSEMPGIWGATQWQSVDIPQDRNRILNRQGSRHLPTMRASVFWKCSNSFVPFVGIKTHQYVNMMNFMSVCFGLQVIEALII